MEDTPVASRLRAIIEALGITDSQFADACSISRPTLSLLLAGKNKKISDVMLSQIHHAFPQVSILWILFGEGMMFKSENKDDVTDENDLENRISPDSPRKEDEELNLINVRQLECIIQDVVNKSFDAYRTTIEKTILKISEPSTLRKVSEITIYYDDSTFETFVPEK
ncbi:MAG: helix-turn-helix transcriptional regulator [Muribaculaceae bacterium]|nr:helix-turn-helix transcriptional regulator [Muribaculaceae bacterium]